MGLSLYTFLMESHQTWRRVSSKNERREGTFEIFENKSFYHFRDEAEKQLAEAKEKGDAEAMDRFERRLVRVSFSAYLFYFFMMNFHLR